MYEGEPASHLGWGAMDNLREELFQDCLNMSSLEVGDDHGDELNAWLTYGSQFADACRVPYPLEQVI